MSKEFYKKKLVDLRAKLAKEKEDKKKDNARIAEYIKKASPASKDSYKKRKIDTATSHDRKIESLKKEIERTTEALKRAK